MNLLDRAREVLDGLRDIPQTLERLIDLGDALIDRADQGIETISDQLRRTFSNDEDDL